MWGVRAFGLVGGALIGLASSLYATLVVTRWSSAAYACHRMLDLSDKVSVIYTLMPKPSVVMGAAVMAV